MPENAKACTVAWDEESTSRKTSSMCGWPQGENVHARLLAEAERFVVVALARNPGANVLSCPGHRHVLAGERCWIGEKLGYGRLCGMSKSRTDNEPHEWQNLRYCTRPLTRDSNR
jgi:hypothetical protein